MMPRTGPINPLLKEVIEKFRKKKEDYYKAIAKKLEKPTRQRVEVNTVKLDKLCKEGEAVVVPGVVLGSGKITKPVTVYAWRFSANAKQKIEEAGGKALPIEELLSIKEKPRIIG